MRHVFQTSFSNASTGIRGNCLWAAIASITEIPLERFKGFEYMTEGSWFPPLFDILVEYGLTFQGTIHKEDKILSYKTGVDGYYVVCGGSPRGFISGHAVVYKNGVMVHDPHPENTGLTSIDYAYMIERITE